jgi:DsbC/DsbD-like thiol-disulfide interchange protein
MSSAGLLLALVFVGAPQTTAHLTLATSVSPATIAPGKKATLALDVTPKPKVHVYAPGQDGYYIAITATLDENPLVSTAGKPKYPPSEKFVAPALNETQLVYSKHFRITEDIAIAATPEVRKRAAAGETVTLTGTVRYQACNDTICFLPTTVPVTWTITLASR